MRQRISERLPYLLPEPYIGASVPLSHWSLYRYRLVCLPERPAYSRSCVLRRRLPRLSCQHCYRRRQPAPLFLAIRAASKMLLYPLDLRRVEPPLGEICQLLQPEVVASLVTHLHTYRGEAALENTSFFSTLFLKNAAQLTRQRARIGPMEPVVSPSLSAISA